MLCQFDAGFLRVPHEALISTMQSNQKFFPLQTPDGALSEYFVGIANIESSDVAQIKKGYERVIRPRFADAQFFYDEDLKQGIELDGAGFGFGHLSAEAGFVCRQNRAYRCVGGSRLPNKLA